MDLGGGRLPGCLRLRFSEPSMRFTFMLFMAFIVLVLVFRFVCRGTSTAAKGDIYLLLLWMRFVAAQVEGREAVWSY